MRLGVWLGMCCVAVAAAACGGGGGGSSPAPGNPGTTPTPVATASPTPAPGPTAAATTEAVPISGGAVNATLPMPSGYSASVGASATGASGATIALTGSATIPASLPVLEHGRLAATVRLPQATGGYTPILFSSLVASAPITLSGSLIVQYDLPTGTVSSSTQCYLAFYDGANASAGWQLIGQPSQTGNTSVLTFQNYYTKGITLLPNTVYGLALFTLGTATSPPPTVQTLAYVEGTSALSEYTEAGTLTTMLPIAADMVSLDDAGNIYAITVPSPAPVGSGSPTPTPAPPTIVMYGAGGTSVTHTYTPSTNQDMFVATSGAGALLSFGFGSTNGVYAYDVWDPGASGAPSRTISLTSTWPFAEIGHDGTLYAFEQNANGTFQYNVYPPGSGTVSRTITEQIVPAGQQSNFFPNYGVVGPDGTLYVTEYTAVQPDTLAGLYIYSPSGTETFVATTSNANGSGPQGVDLDAAGNVYVVNNNAAYNSATNSFQSDSLHDVTVYAPYGTSVLRHITGNFTAYPIAVADDGTAFLSSFASSYFGGISGLYVIASGSTSAGEIDGSSVNVAAYTGISIYENGDRSTAGRRRTASAESGGGHGLGLGPLRLQMMRRGLLHH